jgi:hypothetical protein
MNSRLQFKMLDEDVRMAVFATVLWIGAVVSVYVQALFRHGAVTLVDFLIVSIFSLGAGVLIHDPGKILVAFITTMALSTIALLYIAIDPISGGNLTPFAISWLQTLWVTVIFSSIFPIPLIMYLGSALFGTLLGERLLVK